MILNNVLNHSVLEHITSLEINLPQNNTLRCNRRVHRGEKGGRRRTKYLPIPSLIGTSEFHHLIVKPKRNVQCLRFAIWNAHSVNSKDTSTALCDFVITHQLDVLAITETWLTGGDRDNRTLADIKNTLPNYVLHHSPRLHSRAGGVRILVRNGITVNIHQSQEYRAFEHNYGPHFVFNVIVFPFTGYL